MENAAKFDLNQTIRRWREQLAGQGAFCAGDVEELENHLRESVAELSNGELSQAEAFVVATERLGASGRLSAEYAKMNVARVWTGRAVWMLGGILASLVLGAVVGFFANLVFNIGFRLGMNSHLFSVLHLFTRWAVAVAFIALCFRLVVRHDHWLSRMAGKCLERPIWTGVTLVLGLRGLQLVPRYLMTRLLDPLMPRLVTTSSGMAVTSVNMQLFDAWLVWGSLLTQLFWIISVPLLAGYLWRTNRTAPSSSPAINMDDLQPDERTIVGRLHAQGLTVKESHLVISRRAQLQAPPYKSDERPVRRTWIERGFWMLAGMVGFQLLRVSFLDYSWTTLVAGHSSSPLIQNLACLGSFCLGLALVVAIIAGLWRFLTVFQKQSLWLGRFCCQHSILSAVVFAALCAGLGAGLYYFVEQPAIASIRGGGLGAIVSNWFTYNLFLTNLLIPTALLIWLARRNQTRMQPAC